MKQAIALGGIIILLCFMGVVLGYNLGMHDQATRDEAVRQELLHQLDKLYFGICQDIKDSGDMKLYNRDCI